MHAWRRQLLARLPIHQQEVLLVYDFDDVLSDEHLLEELLRHQFQVMEVKDLADLRLHYEQRRLSSRWLYKIVGEGSRTFPFDLSEQYGTIELTLQTAFPHFPRAILQQLDHAVLDELDEIQDTVFAPLSSAEAIDFLLRRVFRLSYASVQTEDEWVAFLTQVHDHRLTVPVIVKQYVKEKVLQQAPHLQSLIDLIDSKDAFMTYLQQLWERLLKRHAQQYRQLRDVTVIRESAPGPMVKGLLHHYFLEGRLSPIELDEGLPLPPWAEFAVQGDARHTEERLQHISNKIRHHLQQTHMHYKDWIQVAQLWGQMKLLQLESSWKKTGDLSSLDREVQLRFHVWMQTHYLALASFTAYQQPVMVHHILPHLQYRRENKQALIVLDGMGFVQWLQIKRELATAHALEDTGVFAWVPTITEMSRRAIFQAQVPRWHQDISEEQAWRQYWLRESVPAAHVTFENFVAQGAFDPLRIAALQNIHARRSALILRNVDLFSHGAIQGLEGMYAEIKVWLGTRYLQDLIARLVDAGFTVYLTSDHGNTECVGMGRPSQGVLADIRGERVRVYTERMFRDEAAERYESIAWESDALPKDRYYLLAPAGQAFATKGQRLVSHGGMALEEVIVPFVRIAKHK